MNNLHNPALRAINNSQNLHNMYEIKLINYQPRYLTSDNYFLAHKSLTLRKQKQSYNVGDFKTVDTARYFWERHLVNKF